MTESRDAKAEILSRLDITQVVGEYVGLRKRGGRLWGLCPFHTEKTPSFTVNPDKGIFYCFGCHKGGDLFTFVMEIEKIDFREALRVLAEKAGVELQERAGSGDGAREALLELNRRVAGTFQWFLKEKAEAAGAREYLRGRGFGQEILERFGLGYAPMAGRWLGRFLLGKGYSVEFLARTGLFRQGGDLQALFRGRVMFPISSPRGDVVGFGGRILAGSGPKYINSPETTLFQKRRALFGLHQAAASIRRSGRWILVEGYTDVLAMHQAGVDDAVATLGTALTEDHVRLLARYADRGVLLLDADDAGQEATGRSVEVLEENGLTAEVVRLAPGTDPAESLQKDGAEPLKELLKCPISGFEYLLDRATKSYDLSTPGGKEGVFGFLLAFLTKIGSEVKRDGYVVALAESLNVDPDSIRAEYRRRTRGGPPTPRGGDKVPAPPAWRESGHGAELFLALAVAANLEQYPFVRRELSAEDLRDPGARELFLCMEECFRAEVLDLGSVLERIEDQGLRALVLGRVSGAEFAERSEELIRESVRRVKARKLATRREGIMRRLRRSEQEPPETVKELMVEKMVLDREIEELKRVRWDDRPSE